MATHEDLAWIQNPKFELDDEVKKDFQETTGDIFNSTFRSGQDDAGDDIPILWFLSDAYNSGPVFEKRESIEQSPWMIKPHYWCPVTKFLHEAHHHRSDIRIVELFPHGFDITEAEMIFGGDIDLGEIGKPDCYAHNFWSGLQKVDWEDLSHKERIESDTFYTTLSNRKQLNCTKNAMLMGSGVARPFADGTLALVPIGANDWKIVHLRQLACKNHNLISPLPELRHPQYAEPIECLCSCWQDRQQCGQILEWKSSFRPAPNFVFWHYIVALFKALHVWQSRKLKGSPCAETFHVPDEMRWPNDQKKYVRRVAIEMLTQQFQVDYNMIAEIVEPHVFWQDAISERSPEEMAEANIFYSKFAGWLYADAHFRFH